MITEKAHNKLQVGDFILYGTPKRTYGRGKHTDTALTFGCIEVFLEPGKPKFLDTKEIFWTQNAEGEYVCSTEADIRLKTVWSDYYEFKGIREQILVKQLTLRNNEVLRVDYNFMATILHDQGPVLAKFLELQTTLREKLFNFKK